MSGAISVLVQRVAQGVLTILVYWYIGIPGILVYKWGLALGSSEGKGGTTQAEGGGESGGESVYGV